MRKLSYIPVLGDDGLVHLLEHGYDDDDEALRAFHAYRATHYDVVSRRSFPSKGTVRIAGPTPGARPNCLACAAGACI